MTGSSRFGFCGAAIAALALFRGGAWGLAAGARRLGHLRRPALRLGLANLHRPGSPAALLVVSLGIGLTTLAAIAQIEGNLRRQFAAEMPSRAPELLLHRHPVRPGPALRRDRPGPAGGDRGQARPQPARPGRRGEGRPGRTGEVTEETAWALRGDRGLTYAATPPEGTQAGAGAWWAPDYRGAPLVSFDAGIARGWGVGSATPSRQCAGPGHRPAIANLRYVDWRGLGMNFTLVASPGLLEAAPHTHIATVRGRRGAGRRGAAGADRRLPQHYRASGCGMRWKRWRRSSAGSAPRCRRRRPDAGGRRPGPGRGGRRRAAATGAGCGGAEDRSARRGRRSAPPGWWNSALIGLVAGLLAAVAGSAAAWAVITQVMQADWVLLPGTLAVTVLGCAALTLACRPGRHGPGAAGKAWPTVTERIAILHASHHGL